MLNVSLVPVGTLLNDNTFIRKFYAGDDVYAVEVHGEGEVSYGVRPFGSHNTIAADSIEEVVSILADYGIAATIE